MVVPSALISCSFADAEKLSKQKLPAFCEKSAVRLGTGQVQFTDAALLDVDGESKYVFRTGDEITLRLKYHCVEPEKTPKGNFGYGIFREDSVHCYGTNVEIESDSWVALQPDGEIEVRFAIIAVGTVSSRARPTYVRTSTYVRRRVRVVVVSVSSSSLARRSVCVSSEYEYGVGR